MAGAGDGWGFVRNRGNAQAYDDYRNMGLTGLLYNTEDPEMARGLADAAAQGFSAGAWIPAHTGEDPIAYAHRMADYAAKYHPSMLVPNVEFQGKGYAGSAGWNWNEAMMNEFRKLNPTQQLAVSVMGNQDDFNYAAYTGRGAQVWAQAYGGDMTPMDADSIRQTLIKNGVNPALAGVTLAPGANAGSAGNYSAYTLDDMSPAQRKLYAQQVRDAQNRGATPAQAHAAGIQAAGPAPDVLARTNRNALDVRQLGANTTGHILTQKEINALTPKAVAVQTVMSRPPSKARQTARKILKK